MNLKETTKNKNYIFKGKIINLRCDDITLPNGLDATREVIEHNGGVGVVAIDDKDNIIFVNQFRYPYKKEMLEIPAGKKNYKDENPLDCAKRELKEETGAVAKEYISLGCIFPTPGYSNEIIDIYLAKNLEFFEASPDEDEFIECTKININKAIEMIMNNEITDSKTIVGILKADKILKK